MRMGPVGTGAGSDWGGPVRTLAQFTGTLDLSSLDKNSVSNLRSLLVALPLKMYTSPLCLRYVLPNGSSSQIRGILDLIYFTEDIFGRGLELWLKYPSNNLLA